MSFIAELSYADHMRLRAIVRKVYFLEKQGPGISNKTCDEIIEVLGPEVREKLLKRAVDRKLVA